MASTSSITVQSLGMIVQRAPAVGAKMWCLSLFCLFVCLAPSPERRAFDGVLISNKHCVAIYRPIWTLFSAFFHR